MMNEGEKLSVAIVSFNREKLIADCIKNVIEVADEIVVVDSMSADRTHEVAKSLGVRVIRRPCLELYEQKAFAVAQCKNEWVLYLDADEVVSDRLRESIKDALASPKKFSGFFIKRRSIYAGAPLKHVWYDKVLRLFVKSKARWVGKIVHGYLEVDGKVGTLTGDLLHYSYTGVDEHLERTLSFSRKSALVMKEKKFKYLGLLVKPTWAFFKHFFLKKGFLDGTRGLIVSYSAMMDTFARYALLWEKQEKDKSQ